jgi:hypothetical protein
VLYERVRGRWKGETVSDDRIVEGVKVLAAFVRAELSGRAEAVG